MKIDKLHILSRNITFFNKQGKDIMFLSMAGNSQQLN